MYSSVASSTGVAPFFSLYFRDEELPRPVLKRHGFCYQLRVLTCRALTSNRRDPILLYARGLQTLVIAVMYGSMFFK